MRTNLTRPLTFFILGVPRSGTTILCNLFNALEDGFCLGEPHWYYLTKSKREGLLTPLQVNTHLLEIYYHDIVCRQLVETQSGNTCNLAGYKETYRKGHDLSSVLPNRHLLRVDFCLIVFRDPVLTHSSQRALGWLEWDSPDDFNWSYRRLDKYACSPKGIAIVYEDFVKSPLEYLNQRLPFNITGPLELKPTGHAFGDPFANRSTEIVASQREICLTGEEIKAHKPGREIWRKWK